MNKKVKIALIGCASIIGLMVFAFIVATLVVAFSNDPRIEEYRRKQDSIRNSPEAIEARKQAEIEQRLEDMKDSLVKDCVYNTFNDSYLELNRYLKSALGNPSSFKHVKTHVVAQNEEYWTVNIDYTIKNHSGVDILYTSTLIVYDGCEVRTTVK